jgi:hypothetical protein
MNRLKAAVVASVLVGGLAVPSAASAADTAHAVQARGVNSQGQANADPIGGTESLVMPDVVGQPRLTAYRQLHALGLYVAMLAIPDLSCDNIGLVESQNPPPGSLVAPGVSVTIRIYVEPPRGC